MVIKNIQGSSWLDNISVNVILDEEMNMAIKAEQPTWVACGDYIVTAESSQTW